MKLVRKGVRHKSYKTRKKVRKNKREEHPEPDIHNKR